MFYESAAGWSRPEEGLGCDNPGWLASLSSMAGSIALLAKSRLPGLLTICLVGGLAVAEYSWRAVLAGRYTAAVAGFEHAFLDPAPGKPFLYRLKQNLQFQAELLQADGSKTPWEIRTNRYRCRGPDFDLADLEQGTEILLFLGDSYTFGYGVSESEAFPARVEHMLRDAGREVIAINAGVPGFNTVQEFQYLLELLETFDPRAVVLSYVVNDAEPPVYFPLAPEELYEHAGLWFLEELKPIGNWIGKGLVGDGELFVNHKFEPARHLLDGFAFGSPYWRASRDALGKISSECASRDIPFLAAVLPSFVNAIDDTYPYTLIHDRVESWGREFGFRTVDLFPVFHGMDARKLTVYADGHPNADAHELIAETLAARILVLK